MYVVRVVLNINFVINKSFKREKGADDCLDVSNKPFYKRQVKLGVEMYM